MRAGFWIGRRRREFLTRGWQQDSVRRRGAGDAAERSVVVAHGGGPSAHDDLGVVHRRRIRPVHAEADRPASRLMRSAQPAQPWQAARVTLTRRITRDLATLELRAWFVEAGREPVAGFPRVGLFTERVSVPAEFARDPLVQRKHEQPEWQHVVPRECIRCFTRLRKTRRRQQRRHCDATAHQGDGPSRPVHRRRRAIPIDQRHTEAGIIDADPRSARAQARGRRRTPRIRWRGCSCRIAAAGDRRRSGTHRVRF